MLVVYCGTELSGVRNLLWAQMVGRAFAAIVHNSMRSLPAPRPKEDYYGLAINHLNLLLGMLSRHKETPETANPNPIG